MNGLNEFDLACPLHQIDSINKLIPSICIARWVG